MRGLVGILVGVAEFMLPTGLLTLDEVGTLSGNFGSPGCLWFS